MIAQKEKREIALVLGSVFLVAIVGIAVAMLTAGRLESIAGASVKLNMDVPTYAGALILLKEYCSPQLGSGSCSEICGEKTCLPVEENCDAALENNQCLCCEGP